ncbi:MAG: EamA family transporter [Acidovorax sp.]|uniref:EamA family transporter n=1 Tax=Acidovorax sp. TaxID=1872122 RepID=UPI00260C6923|nr:EamA family transporter [Acidovorax sp.]MDH4417190.1 EamA family transporter [Acidovorax sp.]
MAVFSTKLPVFVTSAAIRRIGASKTALIGTLGPILTIFFGAWLLCEPLSAWQLGGAALVLAGVMLISKISIKKGLLRLMGKTLLLHKR